MKSGDTARMAGHWMELSFSSGLPARPVRHRPLHQFPTTLLFNHQFQLNLPHTGFKSWACFPCTSTTSHPSKGQDIHGGMHHVHQLRLNLLRQLHLPHPFPSFCKFILFVNKGIPTKSGSLQAPETKMSKCLVCNKTSFPGLNTTPPLKDNHLAFTVVRR